MAVLSGSIGSQNALAGRRKPFWRTTGFVALLFLLPNLTGFTLFHLGPVVGALVLSLTQWDLLSPPSFVGLSNYTTLIFEDPLFWESLKNTALYSLLSIPAGIVASLSLALAMNQRIRGITFYRTIYFIPVVSSMVAVAMVWRWLYNTDFGMFNHLLWLAGLPAVNWLGEPTLALASVALMSIWKGMGYNMVIFLAGLQGIPRTLYEAADIDGANAWLKFWKITLPLLSPTLFFVSVMAVISSFQVFDQVFIMTSGGPGTSTTVYNYYLYKNAFMWLKMGYASAMAYVLFAIIFVITVLQVRVAGGRVQYDLA
jgi:multiple sugar transport system permease protein